MEIRKCINQLGWAAAIVGSTWASRALAADEGAPAAESALAAQIAAADAKPAPEAKPVPEAAPVVAAAPAAPAAAPATPKPPTAPVSPKAVRGRAVIATHAARFQIRAGLAPVPKPLDAQLDLKGEGALVVHVDPNGAAAKAGIQENDVLVAVGDKPIKNLGEVYPAFEGAEGKEIAVKLVRGGKPLTVNVTPENLPDKLRRQGYIYKDQSFQVEVEKIEKKIREKLNDSGIDMKMQFVLPGKELPKGTLLNFGRRAEFPEDLSVTIRKQGKNPAEIEVKRGDKTWNVKDDDLKSLPEDVRGPVESLLGQADLRLMLPAVKWLENPPGLEHRPHAYLVDPATPKDEAQRARDVEKRKAERAARAARAKAGAERRLEAVSAQLERLHRELEGLRKSLGDKESSEDEEEELEFEFE
ncbi:MAG TPA: PDZ domain-containing protein [Pirellulales bacterium]|jgi:hypothetical protein|nr:PDZ domain-containing protein [Pirellulales bacterium]